MGIGGAQAIHHLDQSCFVCRGSYDISQKKPVAGSNFTQVVKGNSTVKVDSTDYYVLVIANNAGTSPADVLYQFATYSVNSSGERDAAVEACLLLTGRSCQGTQAGPTWLHGL